MSFRRSIAVGSGRLSAWTLKNVFHRNASTLPGRIALSVDSHVLDELGSRPSKGNIVVCGTNGKTTTTNLLAHAVQDSGQRVACNWAGANMATGVTTALLPSTPVEWGVFENDELSTIHIVPHVKPQTLLLLNLFRDQLDRCGEIDHVQDVIVQALSASPSTTLLYDADDPLCAGIAVKIKKAGGKVLSFGIGEDLNLPQERVRGGAFCQECGAPLTYTYHHYGQLGDFSCPSCGFERGELD